MRYNDVFSIPKRYNIIIINPSWPFYEPIATIVASHNEYL